jgi:hypothetical protein
MTDLERVRALYEIYKHEELMAIKHLEIITGDNNFRDHFLSYLDSIGIDRSCIETDSDPIIEGISRYIQASNLRQEYQEMYLKLLDPSYRLRGGLGVEPLSKSRTRLK